MPLVKGLLVQFPQVWLHWSRLNGNHNWNYYYVNGDNYQDKQFICWIDIFKTLCKELVQHFNNLASKWSMMLNCSMKWPLPFLLSSRQIFRRSKVRILVLDQFQYYSRSRRSLIMGTMFLDLENHDQEPTETILTSKELYFLLKEL